MPKKVEITTDWVTIAMEGPTIDGRKIDKDWIKEMADTYNPNLYTAVINAEHYYGNYGTVKELKVGKNEFGAATLDAILIPEADLLSQDGPFKRLFTSIEIIENFRGTGKRYLGGLAITNAPASCGTTALDFKTNIVKVQGLELNREDLKARADEETSLVKAVIAGLKEFFTNKTPENTNTKKEEETMTDEQLKKLLDAHKASQDSFTALADTIKTKFEAPKADPPAPTAPATAAAPAKVEGNSEFTAVITALKETNTVISDMGKSFAALLTAQPGTKSGAGTGAAGDSPSFV